MAGQVSGVDIKVLLYGESPYGVIQNPTNGRIAYFSKLDLTAQENQIRSPIISAGRSAPRPGRGNLSIAGSLETTIAPESIGFWLQHLLGEPVTTGSAAPYTHVFRPKALPPGFAIEKDYSSKIANKVERFIGLRATGGTFTLNQEDYATINLSLIGKDHILDTAALDDAPTDYGHTGWTGFSGNLIKNADTRLAGVTGMTIRVDNNMPGGPYCFPDVGETAGLRYSNPEGRATVSGTISTVFTDFDLMQKAINGDDIALSAIYRFGNGTGTAGNEKLTIKLDHLILERKSVPLDTEAGLMLEMNFIAFATGSTDKGLVCTLLNARNNS